MNAKRNRIVAAFAAALMSIAAVTSSAGASSTAINPLKSPPPPPAVQQCYAKEPLEVLNGPVVGAPLVSLVVTGSQVFVLDKSGAWSKVATYSYIDYWTGQVYYYGLGWTKGKLVCPK